MSLQSPNETAITTSGATDVYDDTDKILRGNFCLPEHATDALLTHIQEIFPQLTAECKSHESLHKSIRLTLSTLPKEAEKVPKEMEEMIRRQRRAFGYDPFTVEIPPISADMCLIFRGYLRDLDLDLDL